MTAVLDPIFAIFSHALPQMEWVLSRMGMALGPVASLVGLILEITPGTIGFL